MNTVRKDSSNVQCHTRMLPNDLEGTSEIELSFPSMWSVVKGHALLALIQRASACTKCLVTNNLQEAKRVVHPTAGKLSLKSATHFFCSGWHTASITSQRMRTPAISKSELVMVPVGFENNRTLSVTSCGHSQQNTVGIHSEVLPITTPPIPWFNALIIPTISGQPKMSSLHHVGSLVDSQRSVWHPMIVIQLVALLPRPSCMETVNPHLPGLP